MADTATIPNLPQPLPAGFMGAKFRPVSWSHLYDPSIPVRWGLEVKVAGLRRYRPIGWQMRVDPFATKAEAQAVCNQLNVAALEARNV